MMLMDAGQHTPECAVHAERRDLLGKLADDPSDPYLLGALIEYYGYGDQEAEVCTCGWYPDHVGHLARMILADESAEDGLYGHTVIYEALQPFLDVPTFKRLGAALELCPVHCCDFQICVDDGIHGDEVYG